jgi:hypothetical protein
MLPFMLVLDVFPQHRKPPHRPVFSPTFAMQAKLNHCLEVPLRNVNLTWLTAAQLHHRSSDFTNAVERMIADFEKKNNILNPKELQVVAYYKIGPGADGGIVARSRSRAISSDHSTRHRCLRLYHPGADRRSVRADLRGAGKKDGSSA